MPIIKPPKPNKKAEVASGTGATVVTLNANSYWLPKSWLAPSNRLPLLPKSPPAVALNEVVPGPGHYLAMFHDDGRFFNKEPVKNKLRTFTLYQTKSTDGGLTWSQPDAVYKSSEVHLCEPGCVRSPDGKTLAVLL
ncbi:glycoside hydrolase, partial [Akkermansiaceae bacterium]|nr:glycoside hydrolase [Akkermansiaceae bacterium]